MSAHGLLGKGVPPNMPSWLLWLKITVLFIALLDLALAAYSISVVAGPYSYYFGGGAPGLLIFVCIKTFIIFGAVVAIEIWAPHMFYRIVALIAYIFSIIFWLSAWAWAASVAGWWLYITLVQSPVKNAGAALAAAAAFGAVAWVLSIVNLFFFIRACLRDPESNGVANTQQAELGHVQYKVQESQDPAPAQGYPTGYPQAPYPQQQAPYPQQQMPYQQPQAPYQQPQQYGQPVYQQQQ